jgi:SP family facilitated glucose transporter-like MFS transporter 3
LSFLSFAVGFLVFTPLLFSSALSYLIVLGEIAPPTLRGTLGTCTQFAIVIGILFSNIIALPLATSTGWRYMFAVGPLLSIVQIVFSPYMVESPRWLLSHDEKSTEARIVIKKLRAFRSSKGKFFSFFLLMFRYQII